MAKKENKMIGIEELFEVANDTRKFEIELFWKRATFFILIIGALFIGFTTFYNQENPNYLLCSIIGLVGLTASIIWALSCMGSKFWQENWEAQVKNLADNGSKKALLFQERMGYKNSILAQPYSVSKATIYLSIFVIAGWLFLIGFTVFGIWWEILTSVVFIVLIYLFSLIVLLKSGSKKDFILFKKNKNSSKDRLKTFNEELFEKK